MILANQKLELLRIGIKQLELGLMNPEEFIKYVKALVKEKIK